MREPPDLAEKLLRNKEVHLVTHLFDEREHFINEEMLVRASPVHELPREESEFS
jgi:hypothetical protein